MKNGICFILAWSSRGRGEDAHCHTHTWLTSRPCTFWDWRQGPANHPCPTCWSGFQGSGLACGGMFSWWDYLFETGKDSERCCACQGQWPTPGSCITNTAWIHLTWRKRVSFYPVPTEVFAVTAHKATVQKCTWLWEYFSNMSVESSLIIPPVLKLEFHWQF